MRRQIIEMISRAPLAWFYGISILIAVLTIPLFLLTGAQEAIDRAFTITGAPFNTDLVTWIRLVVAYPDAAFGAFLAVLQVAAPDLAVAVVVPTVFGWRGLRDLERRFRFWPRDLPWRRGVAAWVGAVSVFVGMSLATAALSRWVLPVEGFTWSWDRQVAPLALGLLTAMFLDGGALFEENGWRGFALPLLLQRHQPLTASMLLGILWALWHLPVKFDLFLTYGISDATLLFAVLTCKFVLISILISYFWQQAGQTTLIAIAMHGLSNDSARLGGVVLNDAFAPQIAYEINLVLPMLAVAIVLLLATRGRLGVPIQKSAA